MKYNIQKALQYLNLITRELFVKYIPDGDMKAYVDTLKENIDKNFTQTMKRLRDKNFQDLLENYPRPKKVFFKGYDIVDTVEDEVMFRKGGDYQKPGDYLKLFEEFVKHNPEQIEAIEILLSKPKNWNTSALDDLRDKLRKNDFSEKDLQKGHELVFKKSLADIISIIKHAADIEAPILTAHERVEQAVLKIAQAHEFSGEQMTWLAYIKEHLIENLVIDETDFDIMPVFERHGGLGRAKLIFGNEFTPLIHELNEALAA